MTDFNAFSDDKIVIVTIKQPSRTPFRLSAESFFYWPSRVLAILLKGHHDELISPGQNGRHFADDIFRCIFVNEKFCNLIKISLRFIRKGAIDNNPALI